VSNLLEVTDEIVALSNRAVDERDAARAEAAELRELAATCGAIAAESIIENDRLIVRQQELLRAIAKMAQELPFPDEVRNWGEQRAKLIAEIGTLKARVAELEAR